MKEVRLIQKYQFYENSTQTPGAHFDLYQDMCKTHLGKAGRIMREDFSGTFLISSEWVKDHPENKSIALDIDPEPLRYGMKFHYEKLTPEQKSRLKVFRKSVMTTTAPKADLSLAGNFSFFIFKEWNQLVRYFKAVYSSLAENGILILEMAGGPGMIEKIKERRRHRKNGQHWYTYIWDQRSYDPITANGHYSIHFILPNGKKFENVFTYDWRMWTIPEVKKALAEAGFNESHVYWDVEDHSHLEQYKRVKTIENEHVWLNYLVGVKKEKRKRASRKVH